MGNMIRKAGAFEILNHWTMAVSCLILAITGYGFIFHLEGLNAVFGSYAQMALIHNYAGIVFSASLFLTIFFYLPESLSIGADDITWLLKAGGYLSKGHVNVPPQGKLNSGQKMFYLALLLVGIAISVSGFVIWLMPGIRKYILLSHLVHNISFDFIVFAIPGHAYLGSLANPGTLRIMITGMVPVEWARKRHAKWVREMGY